MKLYMSPFACSLGPHIALNEAGLFFDTVKVDIPTRKTEAGDDFTKINPKGYIPALVFDDGTILTENVAILSWIADQAPALVPDVPLGRIRMLEMLGMMTAEIHKQFIQLMFYPGDEIKKINRKLIGERFAYISDQLRDDYLFGDTFSAADAMLFVFLSWAMRNEFELAPNLLAYHGRVSARPAVQKTLQAEGLA